MLRKVVLAIALGVLIVSAVAVAAGRLGAWVPVCWGAIIAASLLFERYRYKPLTNGAPGPGWEKTAERFIDNESGRPVSVYIEKTTGERQYVLE